MTIIYNPRMESHTEEFSNMGEVIDVCKEFNPAEQQQYKTFTFCNMSSEEEEMVRCYLKRKLSIQSGVPVSKILQGQPTRDYIYLAEIGHIKLQ